MSGRLAPLEGRTPGAGELMITSGGIDCMELLAKSYLDPGDVVVVEAPTYLGAIMAFRGYEADVRGVPVDDDGMRVDVLADLLAGGLRPKIVYTIPDYQNPTGLSMSRRAAARRWSPGPPLRLPDPGGRRLPRARRSAASVPPPSLWSLAPDVVLQAGHVLQDLLARVPAGLGGRAGRTSSAGSSSPSRTPTSAPARSASGCSRSTAAAAHMDAQIERSRALYARRAALTTEALAAHMPEGTTWTTPRGGFYSG